MYLENRILREEKETSRKEEKDNEKRRRRAAKAGRRKPKRRKKKESMVVTLYNHGKRGRSSKEGHRADALALRAEERRDKLRKAAGRSKYPKSRGYLNGGTHMAKSHVSVYEKDSIQRGTR